MNEKKNEKNVEKKKTMWDMGRVPRTSQGPAYVVSSRYIITVDPSSTIGRMGAVMPITPLFSSEWAKKFIYSRYTAPPLTLSYRTLNIKYEYYSCVGKSTASDSSLGSGFGKRSMW